MKTSLGNEGKLSRRQLTRLGGLIALVGGRLPYDHILDELLDFGFIDRSSGAVVITDAGTNELLRLTAMAGLRPEQYAYESEIEVSPDQGFA